MQMNKLKNDVNPCGMWHPVLQCLLWAHVLLFFLTVQKWRPHKAGGDQAPQEPGHQRVPQHLNGVLPGPGLHSVISAHTILTKQKSSGISYVLFTSSFVYMKKKPLQQSTC